MKDDAKQTIYLKDYKPFAYVVEDVHLTFALHPTATRVVSRIQFAPTETADGVMFLHGEDLTLISAAIDGEPASYRKVSGGIEVDVPDGPFTWQAEVEISPSTNTALEGLYMSSGMYCTQCEAEGFRKITYYPDRPDVMAPFTVRIESDMPVLLSNGNPQASGDGWAEWHDPWPKPAYLFALVAGELVNHAGQFTTMSGKDVELNIWVRPADINKCEFGMGALIRSMKWDEEVYGREYDLDVFNIVAVDDFNMGAMENKGLNIFNSSCVLASPETSTDANFERIEAIIAHEYFHNWTGNRITCRDWFQLCLKEGLTVFRDQTFTGDMRSHAVKRIDDVITLRARQFREDQGPLAHPVRPESFVEINNFYTVTVYEKGAEVIGMLKRLVGDAAYKKALNLYFDRHDGDAATIEDWLKVFEDVTGRDLSQFKLWYSQAGTPHLHVTDSYDNGTYSLTLRQSHKPSPNQTDKQPMVIPVAVGLLSPNGDEVVPTQVLELTEVEQTFTFDGLASKPIPSILRDFSAPVVLHQDQSDADREFLLANDTDPFNKWESGRMLARDTLLDMIENDAAPNANYLAALDRALNDETTDPAFRALLLALPTIDDLSQEIASKGGTPDPTAIYDARRALRGAIARHCGDTLTSLYKTHQVTGAYVPDAETGGKRALTNAALSLISLLDNGDTARTQYAAADNMTQELAALSALIQIGAAETELADFADRWKDDRLVMDKWFSLQTALCEPQDAAKIADTLTKHPDFDWKNPNRFRSLFGGLISNTAGFHAADGSAYILLTDWLIKLDAANPQTAARVSSAFDTWTRYDEGRKLIIKTQLDRILATEGISPDMAEMVGRMAKA
ncbi:aminopeptidase N [Marivivens niveibacter]|uniref:Aminopeptidase N n=1 Tax=Marivivens niveibacter TaxID=1930667 RepID=A0A251WW92_9RHOB|nr:aminopeptidase N [Marivivens niveibacter]OUD08739.1 aminopeptidase N [Marivivens niveibacter]